MQISFQELRGIMKKSGIPVFRDEAPTTAEYPYIVYEFVNERYKRVSNKVIKDMPLYQIAVITEGTEKDYKPLQAVLNEAGVSYSQFDGMGYDENDDTITQFITYVRCMQ